MAATYVAFFLKHLKIFGIVIGLDGRDGIPGEPGLDGVPGTKKKFTAFL